jgi:hypothetical protein
MSPQAGSVGVIRRQVVDDALGEMDITGQRFGVAGAPLAIVGPSVDARAPGFDAELSSQRQRARGALVAVLRTARGDGQLPPPWARRWRPGKAPRTFDCRQPSACRRPFQCSEPSVYPRFRSVSSLARIRSPD